MKLRGHLDRRRRSLLMASAATALLAVIEWPSRVTAAESMPMKIGMIGSGNVGSALGRRMQRHASGA